MLVIFATVLVEVLIPALTYICLAFTFQTMKMHLSIRSRKYNIIILPWKWQESLFMMMSMPWFITWTKSSFISHWSCWLIFPGSGYAHSRWPCPWVLFSCCQCPYSAMKSWSDIQTATTSNGSMAPSSMVCCTSALRSTKCRLLTKESGRWLFVWIKQCCFVPGQHHVPLGWHYFKVVPRFSKWFQDFFDNFIVPRILKCFWCFWNGFNSK